MTISSYFEVSNIKRYAELLRKKQALLMELSNINDEIQNLACFMSNDDINEANLLFSSTEND